MLRRPFPRAFAAAPLLALLCGISIPLAAAEPSKQDILAAMKKATTFMVEKVSNHGGYLWAVSEDFTKQWGEVPARPSQIWVQQSTPEMGHLYLDAYEKTRDPQFLDAAKKVADALIYGQHPMGGWHYFIDFDPRGVPEWYEKSAKNFKWGYEEYRHFYGNCTFDDAVTPNATGYLLRYYMTTLDAAYRAPAVKALDFIVKAQYPNGAWPQRFPLRYEFVHDGLPDYTSYYTLNDGSARAAIEVLEEGYEKLGDQKYWDAAKRGVEFLFISQGPANQAGWAEQFGMDLKPAAARTHEPAGYVIRESIDAIEVLELFFRKTGDARYLKPIPACLSWFERVNKESVELKRPFARYYEWGTNLPVYMHRTDKTNADGYGLYIWDNNAGQDAFRQSMPLEALKKEYERLAAMTPEQAKADQPKRPENQGQFRFGPARTPAELIQAMDARGAWVDARISVLTVVAGGMSPGTRESVRGYSVMSFMRNMRILMNAYGK